jgi:tetratricopeptide (TPR) repeat protein
MRLPARTPLGILVLAVLASAVTPASASAPAQPPADTSALTDEARELYRKGMERYQARQYAQAQASFLAAFALMKHWSIAAALGDCELKLGRFRDAAEHLSFALRQMPADPSARQRADVALALEEARKHVAVIQVDVDLPGAEVLVNGTIVGKAPVDQDLFVEPGTITVEARYAGHEPARVHLDVRAAGVTPVSLRLAKTMPGGSSVAPTATDQPPVERKAEPYFDDGESGRAISTRTIVTASGIGLTLVAAGFGVVYARKASSASDDAEALQARRDAEFGPNACGSPSAAAAGLCADLRSKLDERDAARRVSTIAWVGTGVLAAGTLGAFLLWPGQRSGARLSLAPVVLPDAAAVSLKGRF